MAAGLKDMSKSRKAKFGHFIVEFVTPGIGHIVRNAGCDFVLFDMEHSGFGFETVKTGLRYFEAAGVPVIVRAPSKDYAHIARTCDAGAEGVMIPMVNTAEEARAIVSHMKYFHKAGAAWRSASRMITIPPPPRRWRTGCRLPMIARPSFARSKRHKALKMWMRSQRLTG